VPKLSIIFGEILGMLVGILRSKMGFWSLASLSLLYYILQLILLLLQNYYKERENKTVENILRKSV
jgi:hypothetical protein